MSLSATIHGLVRRLPRFRLAKAALDGLARNETIPRTSLEELQLSMINRIWAHAHVHIPYYRELCSRLNLPAQFATLADYRDSIPTLPQAAVRHNPRRFLSEHRAPGFWCGTGGSTGAPLRAFWEKRGNLRVLQAKYRGLQMWNIDMFARTTYLWGHSTFFRQGIKGRIARITLPVQDALRNRQRLSAYRLGDKDLRSYAERLRRFRPEVIYGYPTAVQLLGEYLRRESSGLDSVRLVILTGERVSPFARATAEEVFRAPVAMEYGSVECGLIANEWPDRTFRVREDILVLETAPREDGNHSIIVTPLTNPSFPLLRYELEDLTDAAVTYPPQGFALLRNILGRHNDFLMTAAGDLIHSSRLDAMFKYEIDGVRRFRVHQQADRNIAVHVEFYPDTAGDLQRIITLIHGLTGCVVSATHTAHLELTPSGKHRLLSSDCIPRT